MALKQMELAANLGTPLKMFNWRMEIPILPGGGDSDALKLRCQSSSKPGFSVESIHTDYMGTPGIENIGRTRRDQSMQFTFIEGEDLKIYNTFKAWYDLIAQGVADADAMTTVYLFDTSSDMKDISKTKLLNAFVKEVPAISRSFDNGSVMVTVTLAWTDTE